jgi:2-polyprenyl-3-methyl-5-hydroxy-6-metoxy-1,4-benzoquinol methylase
MVQVTACPICGSEDLQKFIECVDHTVSHETFSISRCNNCEFLLTTPRPETPELGRYYLSENYISHSNTTKTIIDRVYNLARNINVSFKYRLVKNAIEKERFSVLDYGCGTGDFLLKCKTQNQKTFGIEPSDIAREIAIEKTGVQVFDSLTKISEPVDVITAWHVIEHVADLTNTMNGLYRALNPRGLMAIAVPNHKSHDAVTYKAQWAGYDVPRHLWHFTKQNMQALLEKTGMEIVDIVPMKLDAYYVSLLSEQYLNKQSNLINSVKAFVTGLTSNVLARKENNYSSLIYLAKKK